MQKNTSNYEILSKRTAQFNISSSSVDGEVTIKQTRPNSAAAKVVPKHLTWSEDEQILLHPGSRKVEDSASGVQLIELLPIDLGFKLVDGLFKRSQIESSKQGLSGLSEFKISKVKLINNREYIDSFAREANLLGKRRHEISEQAFSSQLDDDELKLKIKNIFAEKTAEYDQPQCNFLPVWHGTNTKVLDSILKSGFANLAKTDLGYYGKGIYGSNNAEYVKRVYSGGYHKGVLLLNWVAVNSAYPVARMQDIDLLKGKGNTGNFDAHYIPVKPRNSFLHQLGKEDTYFPLDNIEEQPVYDEIVVFNPRAMLARYIVEIERIIPILINAADYLKLACNLAIDEKILLTNPETNVKKEFTKEIPS
jgi:hypothetical protein